MMVGLCAYASKLMADTVIEGRKAELNQELERIKAELAKEMETYKLRLRKQELIFNKELEATTEFMRLRKEIFGSSVDFDDACEEVLRNLRKIESSLDKFRIQHGAFLVETAFTALSECLSIINDIAMYGGHQAIESAGELLNRLAEIEEKLLASIKN